MARKGEAIGNVAPSAAPLPFNPNLGLGSDRRAKEKVMDSPAKINGTKTGGFPKPASSNAAVAPKPIDSYSTVSKTTASGTTRPAQPKSQSSKGYGGSAK